MLRAEMRKADTWAMQQASSGKESVPALLGFACAGALAYTALNVAPADPPDGRQRHRYGAGPFARLVMPPLPTEPGLYAWQLGDEVAYLGQTRTPLRKRLGSNGYSTISTYNTLAREPGRTNGGQQTNCRVNALTNAALSDGMPIRIWFHTTSADRAAAEEAAWMCAHGMPAWNRRLERLR